MAAVRLAADSILHDFLDLAQAAMSARQAIASVEAVYDRVDGGVKMINGVQEGVAIAKTIATEGFTEEVRILTRKVILKGEQSLTNSIFNAISKQLGNHG